MLLTIGLWKANWESQKLFPFVSGWGKIWRCTHTPEYFLRPVLPYFLFIIHCSKIFEIEYFVQFFRVTDKGDFRCLSSFFIIYFVCYHTNMLWPLLELPHWGHSMCLNGDLWWKCHQNIPISVAIGFATCGREVTMIVVRLASFLNNGKCCLLMLQRNLLNEIKRTLSLEKLLQPLCGICRSISLV